MYRPLPDGLTIKDSGIDGLGVVATKTFKANTILGIVHVVNKNFPHGYIRTALGAFYNHSDTPNCRTYQGFWHQLPVVYLMSIKDIKTDEQLTVRYTFYSMEKSYSEQMQDELEPIMTAPMMEME